MPSRAAEASVGLSKLRLGASPAELATGGSLRELGTFYGTDKATLTNFVDVYAEVLPHGAERWQVRSVLEIGVFFGASIKMWRDFYPNATIYGIDAFKGIEGYKFHGKHQKFPHPRAFLESWQRGDQGARIELIQADENIDAEMDHARRMLRALLRNSSRLTGASSGGDDGTNESDAPGRSGLDVLIDDASHLQRNQQANLGRLFPFVRPGGLYVVEDMHCSFITGYDTKPYPSPDTTYSLLERFNKTGRFEGSFKQALTPQRARYLERWAHPPECYAPAGKVRERAFTCVLRKRNHPIESKR